MAKDLTKKELRELLETALAENKKLQRNTESNERELLKAWEQIEELKDQINGLAEMMGISVDDSSLTINLEDQLSFPDSTLGDEDVKFLAREFEVLNEENNSLRQSLDAGMLHQEALRSDIKELKSHLDDRNARIAELNGLFNALEAKRAMEEILTLPEEEIPSKAKKN